MSRFFTCFLFALLTASISSNAQFSKGMRMSGATIGTAFFNSGTADYSVPSPTSGYTINTNTLGLNLSPGFGWFITDNIVVGAQLSGGYKYDKTLKSDESNVTYYKNIINSFNLSVGAFARNYFQVPGSFTPFAQASFSVGFGSSRHEGFGYNTAPVYKDVFDGKSSGDFLANAGIALGATKMLNKYVGLDLVAGYTYSINNSKYKTNTDRDIDINGSIDEKLVSDLTIKSRNHGFALGVGFQVFFGGK
jgi:hypothetical protein